MGAETGRAERVERESGVANDLCFSRSFKRMNWATPVPIIENAGISSQNHHPAPIDLDRAIATMRKARPMKMFLNEVSSVSWPRRLLPGNAQSAASSSD